jgi:hypothetical protein
LAVVTDVEIKDGDLVLTVEGLDKLLALRSHLTVPLRHITGVRADPDALSAIDKGWKVAGSGIPGVLRAGIFQGSDGRVFWDVHGEGHAIVITLSDESYGELVVDVADPGATVAKIKAAL